MKKTLINVSAASALLLAAHSVCADDIRINFSGKLIVPPCDLSIDSPEQTVQMGTFDKRELISTGKSRATPFHITVNTCETTSALSISFSGQPEPLLAGALAINGAASGVAIVLEQADSTPIAINTDTLTYPLSGTTQERLSFNAYLLRLNGKGIVSGNFTALVNVTAAYP